MNVYLLLIYICNTKNVFDIHFKKTYLFMSIPIVSFILYKKNKNNNKNNNKNIEINKNKFNLTTPIYKSIRFYLQQFYLQFQYQAGVFKVYTNEIKNFLIIMYNIFIIFCNYMWIFLKTLYFIITNISKILFVIFVIFVIYHIGFVKIGTFLTHTIDWMIKFLNFIINSI